MPLVGRGHRDTSGPRIPTTYLFSDCCGLVGENAVILASRTCHSSWTTGSDTAKYLPESSTRTCATRTSDDALIDPLQAHLRQGSSTRTRYLDSIGGLSRMARLVHHYNPRSRGYPFPYPHLSTLSKRLSPGEFRVSSLAQNLPWSRRVMVRLVSIEGRGLREDFPRPRERGRPASICRLQHSRNYDGDAFLPYRTDPVPRFPQLRLEGHSELFRSQSWTTPTITHPQDQGLRKRRPGRLRWDFTLTTPPQ